MKTLLTVLLLALSPWVMAGEKLLVEFQVYLGAYEAESPAQVVVTLPKDKLAEAKGANVIEEIQKTLQLKSMRMIGAPVLDLAVPGEAAYNQVVSELGKADAVRQYRLRVKSVAREGQYSRLQVGLSLDGKPETGMEIYAKTGVGVALANRLDGHVLVLLATVHEEGKEVIRPQPLKRVDPVYPEALRQAKVAGDVVLNLTIDETGRTAEIKVVSADQEELAQAAKAAVSGWTWRPGTVKGKPKSFAATVKVSFRMY
jgi:TonB family protein